VTGLLTDRDLRCEGRGRPRRGIAISARCPALTRRLSRPPASIRCRRHPAARDAGADVVWDSHRRPGSSSPDSMASGRSGDLPLPPTVRIRTR
jgi:hypothetical protein